MSDFVGVFPNVSVNFLLYLMYPLIFMNMKIRYCGFGNFRVTFILQFFSFSNYSRVLKFVSKLSCCWPFPWD